jgi:hypothetical protein
MPKNNKMKNSQFAIIGSGLFAILSNQEPEGTFLQAVLVGGTIWLSIRAIFHKFKEVNAKKD